MNAPFVILSGAKNPWEWAEPKRGGSFAALRMTSGGRWSCGEKSLRLPGGAKGSRRPSDGSFNAVRVVLTVILNGAKNPSDGSNRDRAMDPSLRSG